MARKRKHAAHENHERWLISYADFITLLFALFVVMFASSQTDKKKAREISESVKDALEKGATRVMVREILGGTVDDIGKGNAQMRGPGGARLLTFPDTAIEQNSAKVTELTPSMKYLTAALAQEIKDGKLDVKLDSRGLVISLRQAAFFPSGGDDIAVATLGIIGKIATVIAGLPNPVRLEGHTDSLPIRNTRFRSNWELSAARSIAMLEALAGRYQLPRDRFSVAGYADTVPVDSNDTPEGRMRNRRVDIVILTQKAIVSLGDHNPAH